MLPVVASANAFNFQAPIQTPLVNTAVPGASTIRVPADNVAPSISNQEVQDNSKFINVQLQQAAAEEQQQLQQAGNEPAASGTFTLAQSRAQAQQQSSVQATFIAQLAAQDDDSPELHGILQQYEKQLAISNVKYKPSYAFKPLPEPSSVFGKILQNEKISEAAHVQQSQAQAAPAAASSASLAAESAVEHTQPAVPAEARPPARNTPKPAPEQESEPSTSPGNALFATAFSAYAATSARVDNLKNTPVESA